jgi:prophage antirepressor-like protein
MPDLHSSVLFLPLHYHGHPVRVSLDASGLCWWVAQDVSLVLGMGNIRSTLALFPDDEKGVHTMDTLGGPQTLLTLNEPGLYRLIFQSRKSEAEALKRWVFHEVLPTLRRTGTYTVPQAPDVLTPQGMLPPPTPRIKEHAEVSWHLAAVWALLRDSQETLTNREIAQRTGVAARTARAHTRYLLQLGMLDLHETFPRHLYVVAAQAQTRARGVYERLNMITSVIQARQAV